MKIILTSKPNYDGYSIEAGFADNIKHFDHHGKYENYPSPCNNKEIKAIKDKKDAIIEITHFDSDTFVGLLRLMGISVPNIDLNLMEQIDNNGSSICNDKYDITLLYIIGIKKLARNLKFPCAIEERQDVTDLIMALTLNPAKYIINIGIDEQKKSEKAYKDCLIMKKANKALFVIDEYDPLDPSRPYEDGIDIVVVYRKHYSSISIYCNPNSKYEFGGKTIAGIEFNGHPKACGSPRGIEMTYNDLVSVFEAI